MRQWPSLGRIAHMTEKQIVTQSEAEKMLRALRAERKGKGQWPLFSTFLEKVLRHLGFPKATRTQLDMAHYLQFGASSTILQAFRGVGKSFVTSAFVVWVLDSNPQAKIMVVSANGQRAADFSQFTMRLILEMPELAKLRPGRNQRQATKGFDVGPAIIDHSPSVKSVGINGQLTGSRADVIIADDVEIPKNSFTVTMRDRLSELVKEFDNVLKPLPTSRVIYLGTPQTEMSLYNTLVRERGYHLRVWPARVPADPSVYKGNLAPMVLKLIADGAKPGTPVDPERFDEAILLDKELKLGRSTFRLQFQLDTTLADGSRYPLKLEDLIVMGLDMRNGPADLAWGKDPRTALDMLQSVGFSGDNYWGPIFVSEKFTSWQGCVMAIDPSGRGEDETAYAVVRMLHGRLFLVASGGMKGGYTDANLTELANIARVHAASAVVIESNFGDGMFGALLKPYLTRIWPVSVEEARASGQKETRIIQTIEPVLQQHRLVVDKAVIEKDLQESENNGPAYSLFYQLTRITKDRGCLQHDDRLDALEMAVAYWLAQMEVDADKAAKDAADDELMAMIDEICEGGPVQMRSALQTVFDRQQSLPNIIGK